MLALAASCVTPQQRQENLTAWLGHTEERLVSTWGVPSAVYSTENAKFLTYSKSYTQSVAGIPATYRTTVIGNTAYTTSSGGTAGYSVDQTCKTTFEIRNGRVWRATFTGSGC